MAIEQDNNIENDCLSFTDNFRDLGDDFMSKDIVLDLHNPLDFMIQHYCIPSDALSHALSI